MRLQSALLLLLTIVADAPASMGQPAASWWREFFDSTTVPHLPQGWRSSQARSPGSNDFQTSSSLPRSAPNAVLCTNATIGQWLVSPALALGSCRAESLRFALRRSSTHAAKLLIDASPDSGRTFPWSSSDTLVPGGSSEYQQVAVLLPDSLAWPSLTLRWRLLPASSGATATLRIDDIALTARAPIDLELRAMRLDAPPRTGAVVPVTACVVNRGTMAPGDFSVRLFVDEDADSLPVAAELRAETPGPAALAPGDSVLLTMLCAVPACEKLRLIALVVCAGDGEPANDRKLLCSLVGAGAGAAALNEIMYAPAGQGPEWVEVINGGTQALRLEGWSISDAERTTRHTAHPGAPPIPPGGLAVLTGDSAGLLRAYGPIACPVVVTGGFPSLNNGGDLVAISDATGSVVDSVRYAPSWGGSSGTSLERVDIAAASIDSANWRSSQDSTGATPGRSNSVRRLPVDLMMVSLAAAPGPSSGEIRLEAVVRNCGTGDTGPFSILLWERNAMPGAGGDSLLIGRYEGLLAPVPGMHGTFMLTCPPASPGIHRLVGEITLEGDQRRSNNCATAEIVVPCPPRSVVVNEIMFAPAVGGEYLELVNISSAPLRIARWTVADLPGPSGTAGEETVGDSASELPPGSYVVISRDSALLQAYPHAAERRVLLLVPVQGSLALNNDADAVVVRDAHGVTVDSVAYQASWHAAAFVDGRGRSLERIRPQVSSTDARNWSSCVVPEGGTPGYQNSIARLEPSLSSALRASPNPFSPDGDGHEDATVIHLELPGDLWTVSLTVYDILGREVRHLARCEPLGSAGELIWDGMDDARCRARIGPYILYLEAADLATGAIMVRKAVVVLAGRL